MPAPVELFAVVQVEGHEIISARCGSDPAFTHVQDLGDAMQAALERGVDLVIPAHIVDQLGPAALPAALPSWIVVRRV